MKRNWVVGGAVLLLGGLLAVPAARAQRTPVTKERLDAFGASFKQAQAFYNKLTPDQRNMLSGSALNYFHVVNNWPQLEREVLRAQDLIQQRGSQTPQTPHIPTLPPISPDLRFKLPAFNQPSPIGAPVGTTTAPVNVTDVTKNFMFSASGGFTQNETSTAWCGTNVVVAFNDSGSFWESVFATGGTALSFNGYGTSSNQGTTDYMDRGFLPSAGPGLSFPFLGGDPVVACTSATNFYYSSILSTSFNEGISVSHSTDGGVTWGPPVFAATTFSGFLDKPWMAVSPTNPMEIDVSYTNFNTFGSCGFGSLTVTIEVVMSTNGGATWSPPTTVFKTCGGRGGTNDPFVQGSQMAFSPNGTLYVAFEFFPEGFAGGRQILFATPFAPVPGFNINNQGIVPVTTAIDNITGVGDGFQLAGGFRNFIDFQGIAVDNSGISATNGNIYLVWQDTDPADSEKSFNGIEYEYSDIFISVSTNGGASWSPPVKVNTNAETSTSQADSYMPDVAVDQTSGSVGVCWYDRRADVNNYLFQRFCGKSTNAGASFTNFAQTNASFQPIHGTDNLLNTSYLGDYDTLTTDVLKTTSGFIGAFQVVFPAGTFGANLVPNPIVRARNFD